MHVRIRDGQVEDVELRIYEPPRFFEAFLRGRALHRGAGHHRADLRHLPGRLPDERVRGDRGRLRRRGAPTQIRALRRLLYCGEWIESHALHVFLLHAPDFLGYDERDRDGARPPRRRRAGAAAEEGRQRRSCASSAAARSTRSTCASAASTARRRAPSSRRCVEQLERAREFALRDRRAGHGVAAVPGLRGGLRASSRCATRTTTRSSAGGCVSSAGLDLAPARVRGALRRGARRALDRAALAAARRRRATSSARWPASRSTATGSRRLAREAAAARRASSRCAATRSGASSCARSRSSTRSTRRCASSTPTSRPTRRRVEVVAARRRRARLDRGAARPALPPLRARRRRHDPRRADRPADLAEPGARSRPTCAASSSATSSSTTTSCACAASRRSATTTRASPARPTSCAWRSTAA